jgi:hypothetical protein
MKRKNPRLYAIEVECKWGSASDGLMDLAKLSECMVTGNERVPSPKEPPVIATDAGLRRDYTGWCVATRVGEHRYQVHKLFREHYAGDVSEFLKTAIELKKEYGDSEWVIDQGSAALMQEVLNREGIYPSEIFWHSSNRSAALDYFIARVADGRAGILMPESDELRQECSRLVMTHTKTGMRRIEHRSSGHDDLLFSVILAIEYLKQGTPPTYYERSSAWQTVGSS